MKLYWLPLLLLGSTSALAYVPFAPNTAPHVQTNAALGQACVGTAGCTQPTAYVFAEGVWRDDFAAGNGAPPVFYKPSPNPCPLNGGAGDGGSQVRSADGKCWLGDIPVSAGDIRIWGARTAATDNTTFLNAAGAWANALGGADVLIPAGVWIVGCTTPWTAYSYDRFVGVGEAASIVRLCANSPTDAFQTVNVNTMVPSSPSTSSVAISNSGAKNFTVGTGLQFTVGQRIQAVNSTTNFITGTVASYNSGTGALVITADKSGGTGTLASWTVTQVGNSIPAQASGATGPIYVSLQDMQIDGNAPNNTSNPNGRCMYTYAQAMRIDGTLSVYNCQGAGWEMHGSPRAPNFAGENAIAEMGRLWITRANQRATPDFPGGIGGGGLFVNGGTDGRYSDVLVGWTLGGYGVKTGPNGNYRSTTNEYYGGGYPGTTQWFQPDYAYINECLTGQCFTSSNMMFSNGANRAYILVRNAGFHLTGGGYSYTNVLNSSSTTNTIGTGTFTFTTDTTQLGFEAGKNIHIQDANSGANTMDGTVNSYNPATGVLVVNITASAGGGTHNSWFLGPAFYQTYLQIGDTPNGYTNTTDVDVDTYVQDTNYNYLVNYSGDGGFNRIRIRGYDNYNNQATVCTTGTRHPSDVTDLYIQTIGAATACLDTYKEFNSWTPSFAGAVTPGTPTYSSQRSGTYTISSDGVVHVSANVVMTALGGMTGDLHITGLPITSNINGFNVYSCTVSYLQGVGTNGPTVTMISGLVPPNTNYIQMMQSGPGQTTTTITNTNLTAPVQVAVSCEYFQ